jgi:hypothetical protein
MAEPILALGRLAFDEAQGKVTYRYGKADDDKVEMDYLGTILIPSFSQSRSQAPLCLDRPSSPQARAPSPVPRAHLNAYHLFR